MDRHASPRRCAGGRHARAPRGRTRCRRSRSTCWPRARRRSVVPRCALCSRHGRPAGVSAAKPCGARSGIARNARPRFGSRAVDAVIAASNDRAIEGVGTTEDEWLGWSRLSQLPALTASEMVPHGARAVVVAPHPDDEILAVGGLLAHLARVGTPVLIVAVTDGTASHVGSTEWPVERLVRERPIESRTALHRLGVDTEPVRLGLPDGRIEGYRELLAE